MDYYGIDVHKNYSTFTCMNKGRQVLRRGRVSKHSNGADRNGSTIRRRCKGGPRGYQ